MQLVIVESPAKAKTIEKYLGSDYKVLASYGHVRDLPPKDGSVRPDEGFAMDWELYRDKQKRFKEISDASKQATRLVLATDPDREGEAISWHVQELLRKRKTLPEKVDRVTFNAITKQAVTEAMKAPRELDQPLIDAYLARRALDYLYGFTLSPVLWRRLPGAKSAGRVQSVALRLIVGREIEIEHFRADEYWSVIAKLQQDGSEFDARLVKYDGKKLDKLTLGDEASAMAAKAAVEAGNFTIEEIETKPFKRNPAPPFTTSTLQQEAARKLGFSATRTMQTAQKLYEGVNIGGETTGLITYMRTDGVQMAGEAIGAARGFIGEAYGGDYVPASARVYKSKAKNAQEAHEAIRPTDIRRRPEDLAQLDPDQRKLYELIWKRTIASQMESAVIDQVAVDLRPAGAAQSDDTLTLRATGSVIAFDGFLKLYLEGTDDDDDENGNRRLPNVSEGMALERTGIETEQHFTQPPPRFSEASLVKRLEELGIGRPSTYASILSVLQERDYVLLEKRRFVPEDRGRLVTAFLSSFFKRYVEYDFTADLEEKLDDISGGRIDWKTVLRDFWTAFNEAVEQTSGLRVREVLDNLNGLLGPHFFRDTGNGDPRACPTCDAGQLSLKLGRYGAFIGCSNYPDCRYTRPLVVPNGDEKTIAADAGPVELGIEPDSGLCITLRRGPYGYYVQLGEPEGKTKPKRASITKDMDPETVDLQIAIGLLSLPRDIGPHPESREMIQAGIGRFGPYIKHEGTYVSLKQDSVLEIGLNRAVALLADAPRKPAPKEIGAHPKDGKPITIRQGRWGPYVQHGRTRAAIPKGTDADSLTVEAAAKLIAAKNGKGGQKTKAKAKAKTKAKAPAKKSADA